MTKKTKQTASTSETADQVARDIFRESLIVIRDEIRDVQSDKRKPKKHTKAETVAYLSKQAAFTYSELRKADAAEHKRSSSITKALVLDWFRGLEPAEQAQFVRELQQLGTKRSGLA